MSAKSYSLVFIKGTDTFNHVHHKEYVRFSPRRFLRGAHARPLAKSPTWHGAASAKWTRVPFLANRNGFARFLISRSAQLGLDLDSGPLTQGHVCAHESQANPIFFIKRMQNLRENWKSRITLVSVASIVCSDLVPAKLWRTGPVYGSGTNICLCIIRGSILAAFPIKWESCKLLYASRTDVQCSFCRLKFWICWIEIFNWWVVGSLIRIWRALVSWVWKSSAFGSPFLESKKVQGYGLSMSNVRSARWNLSLLNSFFFWGIKHSHLGELWWSWVRQVG